MPPHPRYKQSAMNNCIGRCWYLYTVIYSAHIELKQVLTVTLATYKTNYGVASQV